MSELSEKIKKRREATDFDQLQTNFRRNYNPSFLSSVGNNLISGAEAMGGGVAKGLGQFFRSDTLENIGDELQNEAQNLNEIYGTSDKYADMGIFDRATSLDYLTDPRGLTSSVTNGLGSSLPLMALTALFPEFTIPGTIARGTAAKLFGEAGANWVARKGVDQFLNAGTKFATVATPFDATAAQSEMIKYLREQGYSEDEISRRMLKGIMEEYPMDMLSNMATGGLLMGKIPFMKGSSLSKRILRGTGATLADATLGGEQEMYQSQVMKRNANLPAGTLFNPLPDEELERTEGFFGEMFPGAVATARDAIFGDTAQTQNPPMQDQPQKQSKRFNYDDFSDLNTARPDPKRIYDFWRAYGMNKEAAIGILASMDLESAFRSDNVNSIGATGLFQFLDDRKTDYFRWCDENGIQNPYNALPQLQYVVEVDMKNQAWAAQNPDNRYRAPLRSLKNFEPESMNDLDAYSAAHHWEFRFERCEHDVDPELLNQRVDYWRQQLGDRDSETSKSQRNSIPTDRLLTQYFQKWSSALSLDTPWENQDYTNTVDFKPSMFEFLNVLGERMNEIGVKPIITGGADQSGHAEGTYSHANGYKVDLNDNEIPEGSDAYNILMQTAEEYGAEVVHEAENGHYDIVIRRDGALNREIPSTAQEEAGAGNQSNQTENPRPLFDLKELLNQDNIESGLTNAIVSDYLKQLQQSGNKNQKNLANQMLDQDGEFRFTPQNLDQIVQTEGQNIVDFTIENEGRYLIPQEVRNQLAQQQMLRKINALYAGNEATARDADEKINYYLNYGKKPKESNAEEIKTKTPPEWKIPHSGMTQEEKANRMQELLAQHLAAEMQGDQNALKRIETQMKQLKNAPIIDNKPTENPVQNPQSPPVEENQVKARRTPPEILDAVKLTGKKPKDAGDLHVEMLDDNQVKLRGEMSKSKNPNRKPVAFKGLKDIAQEIGGTYNSRSKTFNFQNPEDAELFSQTARIYLDNGMESLDREPPVETRPWDNIDSNKDEIPQNHTSQNSVLDDKKYPDKDAQRMPLESEVKKVSPKSVQNEDQVDKSDRDIPVETRPWDNIDSNKDEIPQNHTSQNSVLDDKKYPDKEVHGSLSEMLNQGKPTNDDDKNQNGISDEAERIFSEWWNRREKDRKNPKIAQIMDDTQDRVLEKLSQTTNFDDQVRIVKREIQRAENIIAKIRPWDKYRDEEKMNEKIESTPDNETKSIPDKNVDGTDRDILKQENRAPKKNHDKVLENPAEILNQLQTKTKQIEETPSAEDVGDDIHEEDEEEDIRNVYPDEVEDEDDDELIDTPESNNSNQSIIDELNARQFAEDLMIKTQPITFDEKDLDTGELEIVKQFADDIATMDNFSRNQRYSKVKIRRGENDARSREYLFTDINKAIDFINAMNDNSKVDETRIDGIGGATIFQQSRGFKPQIDRSQGKIHVMDFNEIDRTPRKKTSQQNQSTETESRKSVKFDTFLQTLPENLARTAKKDLTPQIQTKIEMLARNKNLQLTLDNKQYHVGKERLSKVEATYFNYLRYTNGGEFLGDQTPRFFEKLRFNLDKKRKPTDQEIADGTYIESNEHLRPLFYRKLKVEKYPELKRWIERELKMPANGYEDEIRAERQSRLQKIWSSEISDADLQAMEEAFKEDSEVIVPSMEGAPETKKSPPAITLPEGYQTESGRDISEADKDEFIVDKDGNRDFGEISKEIEDATNGVVKSAPIRLTVGHNDFGYIHLAKHKSQMLSKGFDNAIDFVKHILNNFNQIYIQSKIDNNGEQHDRYVLYCKGDESKGFMPMDLQFEETDDKFFKIVTATPHNKKIKGRLVFDGSVKPSIVSTDDALSPNTDNKGGVEFDTVHAKTNSLSKESVTSNESEVESNSVINQDLSDAIKLLDNRIKGLTGKSLTIYSEDVSEEEEIGFNARYKIVDASELITSLEHLGGIYGINHKYPQALQPRDRLRVAMQDGISKMAGRLKPRKITESEELNQGAPVVRSDGVVLNGNGRALAIITAYSRKQADNYRNYLIAHAEDYGINADEISKIDKPILIREITDTLDQEKTQTIIGAMIGGTQLGESEQAIVDAKQLRLKDLNGYESVKNGNISAPQNRTFLNNVASRIIPESEYNKYTTGDSGSWNASAIRRVKQALMAIAYPDNELVAKMTESTEDDIKNIPNALDYAKVDVAHAVLMMKENHAYQYNLSETIARAVQLYDKIKQGDGDVQNFIRHNETAIITKESDEVCRLLAVFDANKSKTSKLGEFLSEIARAVEAQGDPQLGSGLFGDTIERETLMDIINRVTSATFFEQPSLFDSNKKSVKNNNREYFKNLKILRQSQLTAREKSIQDLGKKLGVPVVFFEGNKNLHGYFAGGVSFINRNSATSLEWTFWHESFHAMNSQNPNLYNQILSKIKKSQSFTDKQIDAYRKEIGAFSLSDDEIIEELLADNMQDAARRSGIIDSLKRNRNLFQKFVDFIRELYDQVKDYFNAPENKLTKAQRDAMTRAVSRIASSIQNLGINPKETKEIKENIERGKQALKKILESHEDVNGAMTRPETGAIDFVWGEEGNPKREYRGGYGISKILAKHGQKAVDMIPEVIAKGIATNPARDRVYFEHNGYRAVVRFDWNHAPKTWLVTNFEKTEREKLDDANAVTRSAPTAGDTISAPELDSPSRRSLSNDNDQIKFSNEATNRSKKKSVVEVTGKEFGDWSDIKELRKKAIQYYREHLQGTSVQNPELGKIDFDNIDLVEFTGSGRDKVKATSANPQKLLLIPYLPKLIATAEQFSMDDSYKDKHSGESFYYLRSYATINGEITPINLTLFKSNNKHIIFYNHNIVDSQSGNNEGETFTNAAPESSSEVLGSRLTVSPSSESLSNANDQIKFSNEATNRSEKKSVVEVSGKELGEWKDIDELREKALKYYKDHIQKTSVFNPEVGKIQFPNNDGMVAFTRKGYGKISKPVLRENKYLLVPALPQLIENATDIKEAKPETEKHSEDKFYYITTEASIDGEKVPVHITLIKYPTSGIIFYDHDLFIDKARAKKEDELVMQRSVSSQSEALDTFSGNSSSLGGSLSNDNEQIKFSINESFNNINDRFAKSLGLKPTSDRINVVEAKPIDGINLKQYYFGSPSRIKNQIFQFFFENARKGMQKLVQLRNKYARKFKDALDLLSNDQARDNLYELLWRGDEEGVEFGKLTSEEKRGKTVEQIDELRTDKIVNETGVQRSAAKAYVKIRRLLESVYRQLDYRKRGVKTKTLYIKPKNLATYLKSFERNKFITIMRIGDKNADGKIPVTIRNAQHWSKTAKNLSQAQINKLQSDSTIQITRSKQNADGTFNITYRQGRAGLNRREGHIPHLFHHFTVRIKKQVGDEFILTKDLEDRLGYHAVIGSGKSQREAIKVAEEWLKSNQLQDDEQIFIEPQMFNFENLGQSESDYAPVMGDKDFHAMQQNIAKNHGMKLSDVKNLVAGSVRSTSRHRFNGYFLKRHGAKGFEKDIQYVLRHYLNASARYIAMDEFKENSINKFEQVFGAFSKDWTDNSLAQYVKNYIRDVNGNPTTLEQTINDALNKSELWQKYFIPHFGDRAALSLTNSLTSRLGYLTLGFFNISSALLNFSQLINAAGYLGTGTNLAKYFCKYMKGLKSGDGTISMRDLSILQKTGALNEIGLDSSNGYDQFRGHNSNFAVLNTLDRFGNLSMGIFQKTDALCRIATTLAAYDQAKSQGKSDAEAIKYAREINRKANFDYSVADAPNIFRRGSIISQLALQFKKYGIKELEVMSDMLSSVTNKKQKAIFWGLYFMAVGLMGVPAGDGLDWLFKDFFNIGSPKNFVQETIMEACGKSPEGKALGRALMYGIAGSVGVNISSRVGLQDVIPTRTSDFAGVAASKIYNLIHDIRHEGFGVQAIRDVSPGAYNILAAGLGESRGARGRLNSTYDDYFERALRALGFKSTDETISADIQRIIYDKRDKLSDEKQKAIDAYIDNPTSENARKLRKLGVKPKTVQEERKRKRMERLGRMNSLLSNKERKENREMLNFAK